MYNNFGNTYNRINNGINWVQGIEGAKAIQMMPNSNTILMDSENDGIFYIKICDNVGMCSLRTFKYEELQDFCKKPDYNVDFTQFVTRDELNEILNSRGKTNGKQSIQSTKQSTTD